LLYTKILEGLQQKQDWFEPLSPIAGATTDKTYAVVCRIRRLLERCGNCHW